MKFEENQLLFIYFLFICLLATNFWLQSRSQSLRRARKLPFWKYGGFDSSLVVSHHRAGIALRTLSLISNHQHKMFVGLLQKRSRWLHAIVLNWCTEWDHVNVYIYTIQTIHTWVTWLKLTCYSPDGVDRFCTLQNIPEKRRRWLQGILDCKHLQVSVCTIPICIYK